MRGCCARMLLSDGAAKDTVLCDVRIVRICVCCGWKFNFYEEFTPDSPARPLPHPSPLWYIQEVSLDEEMIPVAPVRAPAAGVEV